MSEINHADQSDTEKSGDAQQASPASEAHPSPPDHQSPHQLPSFPIVGIGASAGGLQAFEEFFTHMPSDSGMAFVLVQHLDPTQKSILADIISRYTSMNVSQATDGIEVLPNHVYVIPPNRDIALMQGKLHLIEHSLPRGLRLPIDFFFRSLADELHEYAIGAIMSGTGTDGTLGLRAIKGAGGMIMVQNPTSARYDGMLRSAIDTDLVDYIEAPEQMPERLITYTRHDFVSGIRQTTPRHSQTSDALQKIFILLRNQSGHDFSHYKTSTIMRRIERRMAVNQISWQADYVRYLQQNSLELTTLFRELLIGVTNFFRDNDAFESLAQHVIPRLIEQHNEQEPVRIWVPGCSTGEEAYSLAILICEQMDRMLVQRQVQIFATDIDGYAIEKARAGVYPDSIAADVSPERLHYFFRQDNNTYQVNKSVRDMVVFAQQSVVKDPPFSNLVLISCRNLLIYLEHNLQERVMHLFHRALNPDGYLFLGSSETAGAASNLFRPIDRKWQIYQRIPGQSQQRATLELSIPPIPTPAPDKPQTPKPPANLRDVTERLLLEQYSPPSIIINKQGAILYIHGKTGKYWETTSGQPDWNVFRIAREGLQIPLTMSIRSVIAEQQTVVRKEARYTIDDEQHRVYITVRPIADDQLLMIIFEDIVSMEKTPLFTPVLDPENERDAYILCLKEELESTQAYLYTTNEELQASNEELRSSNEELQSANEELQSSNEQLGTSKEELQSVNEELITVNAELQAANNELRHKNNHMRNLLAHIDVGIIFLDQQLRVTWFTPTATGIIHLIDTDIDRPLSDLVPNIDYDQVIEDAQRVLDTLEPQTAEVRTRDTREWYWMSITPYRTTENIIEGVVLTFSNITRQKRANIELRKLTRAVEQSSSIIIITDMQGTIEYINPRFTTVTGYTSEEVMGQNLRTLKVDKETLELHQQSWQLVSAGQQWHGEFQNRKKNGESYWVAVSRAPVWDENGVMTHVIEVEDDITRRKVDESALQSSENLLRSIYTGIEIPIFVIDVTDDRRFWYAGLNPACERVTGYLKQNIQGRYLDQLDDLLSPDSLENLRQKFTTVVETGTALEYEQMAATPRHQGKAWWMTRLEPLKDGAGNVYRIVATARPITDIKQAQIEQQRRTALLAALGKWWQQLLPGTSDEPCLLRSMCRMLVEAGQYHAAWIGLLSHDAPTGLYSSVYVAANHEQSGQSTPAWIESQAVPVLAARTHETSQPVLVYNVQTDTIASTWRDMALSDGIASVLAVPFQVKQTGNASSGVLLVFSVEADTFDKESIGMVQNLSDNLAYGMHIIRTTHLQREGP